MGGNIIFEHKLTDVWWRYSESYLVIGVVGFESGIVSSMTWLLTPHTGWVVFYLCMPDCQQLKGS